MYRFSIAVDWKNPECHGITNLELTDGCFGAPLWQMDGNAIEDVRCALIRSLRRVALYVTDLHVSEYEKYVAFFRNAHMIQAENVLMTYDAIKGADDAAIRKVLRVAEAFSVRVLFRIEAAHVEEFGFERYGALRSEGTGLFYDPCEFVKQGIQPFRGVLYKNRYKDDVVFLRVGDMLFDSHEPTALEKGHAQIKECASVLLIRSWKGYFSFAEYGGFAPKETIPAFCTALTEM